MKLVSLSANRASFRRVDFRPAGLTIILGDGLHSEERQDGDSNGVGKTLALRLVHFCLGGQKAPKAIRASAADWVFTLDIQVGASFHRIDRSGDGEFIALDERSVKIGELRKWLDVNGGFALRDGSRYSFRSLFPRFSRPDAADCASPISLAKETPPQALQRTLYLLGANDELAWIKESLKERLDTFRNELKLFNETPSIRDVFTSGHQPKIRLKEIIGQLLKLQSQMAEFSASRDYREMEKEVDQLNREMRETSDYLRLKEFELGGVLEAQHQRADITKEELISLYDGLVSVFQPKVLRHLDEVQAFQAALSTNRADRLSSERTKLENEIDAMRNRAQEIEHRRAPLVQRMGGRRILDDYASLSRELASLEEEKRRIESYLQFDQVTRKKMQEARTSMVEQDTIALNYVQSEPLADHDTDYRSLIHNLYPEAVAGIVLTNNDGQNRIRFDLDVIVQGQDSDGIGNARVLCFDWLLFTTGRRTELDFLWHDNRLFADVDPKPRAQWFKILLESDELNDRQYIASLNSENFESMVSNLSPDQAGQLREAVVLTLQGDRDENRLMGIRFG